MDLASLDELAADPSALLAELARRVSDNPTLLDIKKANRWLEQKAPTVVAALTPIRIAVLTEQTLEGLRDPLLLFARLAGFAVDLFVCPPYFPEMQLLSPQSELAQHAPDVTFVIFDIEKRSAFTTVAPDEQAFAEFSARITDTIGMMSRFAQRTGSKIAATSFTAIWPPLSSLRETDPRWGRSAFVEKANALLHARSAEAEVAILPLHAHLAMWGAHRCIDVREYCNTDTAFTAEGFNRVAALLVAHLTAQLRPPRSLLIVSPEGALWGRSIDTGLDEAAYGPDSYPGRIFHRALTWMKELRATGVRLAVVGTDRVMDVLQRDDFPLSPDRFAAIVVGDAPVADQIDRVLRDLGVAPAEALFVGASSDDCARVRRAGIATLAVPDHLGEYLSALANIPGRWQRA